MKPKSIYVCKTKDSKIELAIVGETTIAKDHLILSPSEALNLAYSLLSAAMEKKYKRGFDDEMV